MARFDVYANPSRAEQAHTPYVLDVQNEHLGPLASRVVIPLRTPMSFGPPARDLNPLVEVDGVTMVLDTASLASVSASLLKRPVARADRHRVDVLTALDTLFGAF